MQNMNKTQRGQTFLDMVMQQTGDFQFIIDAAILNNRSLSEDVAIGTEIIVKNAKTGIIANRPATAIVKKLPNIPELRGGIGYMEIGKTFKVS